MADRESLLSKPPDLKIYDAYFFGGQHHND